MSNPDRPQNRHLKPIKKGEVRNPHGRPRTPKALLEKKKITRIEFEELLTEMVHYDLNQLKAVRDNPKSTMLQLMIESVITSARKSGDWSKLNGLMDRIVGKVRDQVDVNVTRPSFKIEYLDNTREILAIDEPKQLPNNKDESENA